MPVYFYENCNLASYLNACDLFIFVRFMIEIFKLYDVFDEKIQNHKHVIKQKKIFFTSPTWNIIKLSTSKQQKFTKNK